MDSFLFPGAWRQLERAVLQVAAAAAIIVDRKSKARRCAEVYRHVAGETFFVFLLDNGVALNPVFAAIGSRGIKRRSVRRCVGS